MTAAQLSPPPQMGAGDRITWQAGTTTRSGNVWSTGPAGISLWVVPDAPAGSRKPVRVTWHGHTGKRCDGQAGAWTKSPE